MSLKTMDILKAGMLALITDHPAGIREMTRHFKVRRDSVAQCLDELRIEGLAVMAPKAKGLMGRPFEKWAAPANLPSYKGAAA